MKRFHKIIAEIKSLSNQQVGIKAQRKTVHLKVERSMPADQAACLAANNSYKLMHLFIAYAQLRGKEPQLPTKKGWDSVLVKNFVEHYQAEAVVEH
jgi:hypothetical protein